jgi:hypothetical protein
MSAKKRGKPGAADPAPKKSRKGDAKKASGPSRPAAKKPGGRPARAPAAKAPARRADLGAPIDGFFAKQPPHLRAILDELRAIVDRAAPDATATMKWGMPFYQIGRAPLCALAGFKAHVNLILPGAPGTYDDPEGLLEGDGTTGKHLKIRSLDDLPRPEVRRWLVAGVRIAREKA